MKIESLCSSRAGQDDCGQCQQCVLSFPALTDLQLELKCYMVLWHQRQAPFAKGYLSSGSQRCSFPPQAESSPHALIKSSPFPHMSLASCTLFSLHGSIICGGVPEPGGVRNTRDLCSRELSCPKHVGSRSVVQPGRRAADALLLSLVQSSLSIHIQTLCLECCAPGDSLRVPKRKSGVEIEGVSSWSPAY